MLENQYIQLIVIPYNNNDLKYYDGYIAVAEIKWLLM